jgi:hypothetical protein
MFQHLRPRGVPRLRRCFRIAPPLDNIHRVHRVLILPDDDRGEFDAHRVQTHADAWRSVESGAVPQHPRSIVLGFSNEPLNSLYPTDTHVLPPDLDRVFRRVQDCAHYMPNWQMEVCNHNRIQTTVNLRTDAFLTPERDGVLTRTIVALVLCRFQSHSLCRCLDRAGPSRHARSVRLADRTTRARRGEDPVPKYSGERGERPGLHPHTADGGAAAPARAVPG